VNIVVLVKQVPDTESLLELDTVKGEVNTENVKWIVNPYDEFAIEEALQIREKIGDSKVTVLSVGPKRSEAALRTAMAMGADDAVLIDDPAAEGGDALATARLLAAVLGQISYDLIIAGMRAVDDDAYQVPAAVAEYLDIPLITTVTKATVSDGEIVCEQTVEGGILEVTGELPLLFTTQKGINLPRYASLPNIMKAKKKPLDKKSLADLDVTPDQVGGAAAKTEIVSIAHPPARKPGIIVQGDSPADKAATLVRMLREEAKAL
jgi:electron transfer flavoprotein beta subunit